MPTSPRGFLFAIGLYGFSTLALATGPLIVVGHDDVPPLNEDTLQKIYLGKVVEVNGRSVIPVNMQRGNSLRKAFMEQYLSQDDDKFIAYWTVRRYIGKGTPPREFSTVEEQLDFVRATPGAIGYADDPKQVGQGLRTLLTRP
jgi:hypothetical protein